MAIGLVTPAGRSIRLAGAQLPYAGWGGDGRKEPEVCRAEGSHGAKFAATAGEGHRLVGGEGNEAARSS